MLAIHVLFISLDWFHIHCFRYCPVNFLRKKTDFHSLAFSSNMNLPPTLIYKDFFYLAVGKRENQPNIFKVCSNDLTLSWFHLQDMPAPLTNLNALQHHFLIVTGLYSICYLIHQSLGQRYFHYTEKEWRFQISNQTGTLVPILI